MQIAFGRVRRDARRIWASTPQIAILRTKPLEERQTLQRSMKHVTNLANPNPFHNHEQDKPARDPVAIQYQSAFHTNKNLNNPNPPFFLRNHALWDYNGYNLVWYNNGVHCESVDH